MTKLSAERLAEINRAYEPGVSWAVDELRSHIAAIEAELKSRPVLWECEQCCFGMDARHTHEDGTITCPICELEVVRAERAALTEENEKLARVLGALNKWIVAGPEEENEAWEALMIVRARTGYRP